MYSGTHDGATLYSTISFHVDEFKFYKILKNVIGSTTEKLWDLNDIQDDCCWERETQVESENNGSEPNRFSELSWFTNIELFDMLDSASTGIVSFREFCALIYLVAAV